MLAQAFGRSTVLHSCKCVTPDAERDNDMVELQQRTNDKPVGPLSNVPSSSTNHRIAGPLGPDDWRRAAKGQAPGLTGSLSLLSATLDATAYGVLAIEFPGKIVCCNTTFMAMWGLSSEMLARQSIEEMVRFVASQTRDPGLLVELNRDPQSQAGTDVLDIVELKDGRIFERCGKPLRIDGEPVGRVITYHDITASRRAEESLRENQLRLQIATQASNIGPWDWNLISNEVHFSPEWKAQIGYLDHELEGQFSEFDARLHPDDRERILTAVRCYLDDPRLGYDVEFRLRHKDGSYRWIQTRAALLFDETGKAARMLGCHVDFTERRSAEERLGRLRSEHAVVLSSLGEGVHWLDIDGRIKFENPAAARMLGYDAHDLIGQPAHATMHHTRSDGAAYPQCDCPIHATLRDGVARQVRDEIFWRKDGTSFPVDYSCTPFCDEDGLRTGVVVIFNDITDRKQAEIEKERINKQIIETSRKAGMAEIATNVLHNVGNVLNSVNVTSTCLTQSIRQSKTANLAKVATLLQEHEADLAGFLAEDPRGKAVPGYLAKLAKRLADEQASTIRELAQLQRDIDHIKEIVSTQQNHSKVSGVKEIVDVVALVEDTLRMNTGSPDDLPVKITRDFEGAPPINSERHKILQILVNLIRNAKRACNDSPRADKHLTVRIHSGDGRIRIAVIDNGVGIAPENLTRIFTHGFTTKNDGHGFGLHSGALAAKELGGALLAHSDGVGLGASVTLELPLS